MPYDSGGGGKKKTPQTKDPRSKGNYGAQGYNYSYGTRTPFQPETYTRFPGVGALPAMGGGPPMGPGGGSSRGGSRSGGGGGGGFVDYGAQRRAELERQKAALIAQLTGARDAALPALDQYRNQYNTDIGNIFAQNQALQGGYSQQLAAIAQQMNQGMGNTQASLQRDMMGQGANGPEMQAMLAAANQNMAGTNFLQQNADAYNTRLAQVMAQAQQSAQGMGATIDASSRGQLQNAYLSLLAQIGMMGLT